METGESPAEDTRESDEDKGLSPAAVEEKIQLSETDPLEIASDEILPALKKQPPPSEPPGKKSAQHDLFSAGEGPKSKPETSVADSIKKEKQGESVADKLHKQARVNSLKNAIGINEKFFFINELFEGNLNEYNAAIGSLDQLQTMEDSEKALDELSARYKWEHHAEAAGQLKEFVLRKLS